MQGNKYFVSLFPSECLACSWHRIDGFYSKGKKLIYSQLGHFHAGLANVFSWIILNASLLSK